MPKIPFFRTWFERNFGGLCEAHDMAYSLAKTRQEKYDADFEFAKEICKRGYFWLSILTLVAVNLPWIGKRFK